MIQSLITKEGFDYGQLEGDVFDALVDQEVLLEDALIRSHREIGEILIRVKAILPHGTYMDCYHSKGISTNMAYRCVQIAQGKLSNTDNSGDLPAPNKPKKFKTVKRDQPFLDYVAGRTPYLEERKDHKWETGYGGSTVKTHVYTDEQVLKLAPQYQQAAEIILKRRMIVESQIDEEDE